MLQTYLVKRENGRRSREYRTPEGKWTHHSLQTPLSHSTAPVFSFSEATGRTRSALLGAAPIPPFRLKRGLSSPRKFTQVGQLAQQAAVVPARHDSAIPRSRHSEYADHPRKIEQYAEWLRTTVKSTTMNKELACIGRLMKEAEEWEHLASKPAGTAKELPDYGQVHELSHRSSRLGQFENRSGGFFG